MRSSLRVAYILTAIDFGGSDRVSLNFLKNVDRKRFEIVPILLTRPWEEENIFIRELRKEGYPIEKVPVALRPRSEGRDYFRILRCLKIAHSILKKGSFDLVHTHGYFADIVGIPVAKKLSIPTIATCHGFISNDRNLRIYNRLDRLVLKFSDKIIAVSEEIKKELIQSGINESRIGVILNAVNTNIRSEQASESRREKRRQLKIGEEERVVGYVGRLSEEKGIKNLMIAASMLIRSGTLVKVLILGEGPERKELEALVEKEGLTERVIFAGFQTDVESWMPALDLFCLPSLTEGTPMALLEAMAHGVPVVATAVGGVPGVIQSGRNGLLVSPNQSEALRDAIAQLLKEEALRRSLSEAARDSIKKNYHIDDWTRKIEAQYDLIVKGSND